MTYITIVFLLFACLHQTVLAQTSLSNATTVSGTLAVSASHLYEFNVAPDYELRVTLNILAGSCGNTALRDGSQTPLTTFARVQQLPAVGLTQTAVSACSVGTANKWYFELANTRCQSTAVSYELTVTAVLRPCVLPLVGNITTTGRVYADEEWAFYSVQVAPATEVRLIVNSLTATTTCQYYRLYTRLGDRPTNDLYDTIVSSSSDQQLMEYRSACATPGTLYIAMRENCNYVVGRFSDFSLQVQFLPRVCAPAIVNPFPNTQVWTARPSTLSFFKFTPSALNLNKNATLVFTLRPLPSSPYQGVALYSRLNDFPSTTLYDHKSIGGSYAAIAYTACDLPQSGDIILGVHNPSESYANNLDFQLITTLEPINCDQLMVPGQLYDGTAGAWYSQRYSINFGSGSRMAASFCRRPGSASDSVAMNIRWNAPPNQTVYDWRETDSSPCATYYYDSCITGTTPRAGTVYVATRSAGTITPTNILQYQGRVFLDPRPCVQVVPASGGVYEESIISNTFVYFYSWEAVAGTRITIDLVTTSTVSFFYRFGTLPTPSEYQVVASTFPTNFTAQSSGTHYFRAATPLLTVSLSAPATASVRFYPPGTQPPLPPTPTSPSGSGAPTPRPSVAPSPKSGNIAANGSNHQIYLITPFVLAVALLLLM